MNIEISLRGAKSDTVGAKDSVRGTLLSEIDRSGLFGNALSRLDADNLKEVLTLASQVAGVNCTRAGCRPQTREEAATIFGSRSVASFNALIA